MCVTTKANVSVEGVFSLTTKRLKRNSLFVCNELRNLKTDRAVPCARFIRCEWKHLLYQCYPTRGGSEKKTDNVNTLKFGYGSEDAIPDIFYETRATLHDFKYVHNPTEFCNKGSRKRHHREVKYLFAVASAPWEHNRRKVIRRTWASTRQKNIDEIGVVFFMGNNGDTETNTRLDLESEKYVDIVQESYVDTYRNLSIKTQGQLKWISHYCPNAEFLIHVDDDVFPNVRGIIDDLSSPKRRERSLDIGCAKSFKPVVRRDGKWKTSIKEYPGRQYPLSCIGWCFTLSFHAAEELYRMSLKTKILHLEDIWVTGILREKLGNAQIRKLRGGEALCRHLGWPKDGISIDQKLRQAWEIYRRSH